LCVDEIFAMKSSSTSSGRTSQKSQQAEKMNVAYQQLADDRGTSESISPKQLMQELLGSKVRFVLIKGEPGAGKTTLALELMKNYGGGVYISTRVSKELALAQQPVINELIKKGKVTGFSLDEETLKTKENLKQTEDSENKADSSSTLSESFSFEDYRLSTHEDILAAILKGLDQNLPSKEPLIVLDSWDAIAKRVEPVERQKLEQAMLVMAEAKQARIIFVSEEPALTTVDYVVDAVVSLTDEVLNGRRIRRIAWKKLRGSPIPQRSFIYTLYDGNFTVFENTKIYLPGTYPVKPFRPIRHTLHFYSTGSEDLDAFFGEGIARGSFVVLEIGEHVNPSWHIPIIQSIQSNFLANNGCVFVIPTTHSTPMYAKAKLKQYFPEETLRSSLRVGHFQPFPSDPCFVRLNNEGSISHRQLVSTEIRRIKGRSNRNCVYVLGIDTLENFVETEELSHLASSFSQSMKVTGDLMIAVVKPASKIGSQLTNSCDIHLKLEEVDRTLLLYSLNPASELHHVKYDYCAGYPAVKLTPIL
jgi:KaiC/GvpD/RAD55 family RecA-like ATPase